MTRELTLFQDLFLSDSNVICASMAQLQEKYSYIASKASIKRKLNNNV